MPTGDREDKHQKATGSQRLEMLTLAVNDTFKGYPCIRVSPREIEHGTTIPTTFLMRQLRETFSHLRFSFVLGDELVWMLHTWDLPRELVSENHFIVLRRNNAEIPPIVCGASFSYTFASADIPLYQVSSTLVRKRMKTGVSCRGLVPEVVLNYISKHNLYS